MNTPTAPSLDNPNIDKQGAALDRQRFKMLEDIARELNDDTVFPTSFDTVMRLRKALQDPKNERLGMQVVRSTSLAIVMKQLILARSVVDFQEQAERLWSHSLRSASAAYVVAKRLTRISPDEALLAGMVHDIGAFYMIYRASLYEELVLRPETTKYLILRWHESIGHSLIIALGLSPELADAMADHDQPRPIPTPPKNLTDVVFLANLLAGGSFEWLDVPNDMEAAEKEKLAALKLELGEEIDAHEASLKDALS